MYAIAIDSGGTKIVGAVVDDKGIILDKKRYDILKRDGDFLSATFQDIISLYRKEYPIDAVGIGGNGRIDPNRGIILNCGVHTNWQGRHLREELEACVGIPVSVNNDCYCAIKGELWKGAARDLSVVVGIIIGTGLGGAMASHGKFWNGSDFGAGEIGHMILHQNGLPCYCGQKGCVERYVSGTALWTNYNREAGIDRLSSGYQFFEILKSGDTIARKVMNAFIDDLSLIMVNISNLCNPEAFLIGGGISDTRDGWGDALECSYRDKAGDSVRDTAIVYASTGNDAALYGAAKFAFELFENKSLEDRI